MKMYQIVSGVHVYAPRGCLDDCHLSVETSVNWRVNCFPSTHDAKLHLILPVYAGGPVTRWPEGVTKLPLFFFKSGVIKGRSDNNRNVSVYSAETCMRYIRGVIEQEITVQRLVNLFCLHFYLWRIIPTVYILAFNCNMDLLIITFSIPIAQV